MIENKESAKNIIRESISYNDACVKIFGYSSGKALKILRDFVCNNSIDISHFDKYGKNRKYKIVEKVCPICSVKFTTKEGHPREKMTCSHKCCNTYFRTGRDNGNWKEDSYRSTCFLEHEKKCVVCGEDKIVEVHHYDGNHDNNKPENLIPLCPTHHQYCHSRYVIEIKDIIDSYRNKFINNIRV